MKNQQSFQYRDGDYIVTPKGWALEPIHRLPVSNALWCLTVYPYRGELTIYPDGTKHFIKQEES